MALLFEGLSDSGSQTANAAPPELLHTLRGSPAMCILEYEATQKAFKTQQKKEL